MSPWTTDWAYLGFWAPVMWSVPVITVSRIRFWPWSGCKKTLACLEVIPRGLQSSVWALAPCRCLIWCKVQQQEVTFVSNSFDFPTRLLGLFYAAMMRSGVSINVWSLSRHSRQLAFLIAASLNVDITNSYTLKEGLKKIDAHKLQACSGPEFIAVGFHSLLISW